MFVFLTCSLPPTGERSQKARNEARTPHPSSWPTSWLFPFLPSPTSARNLYMKFFIPQYWSWFSFSEPWLTHFWTWFLCSSARFWCLLLRCPNVRFWLHLILFFFHRADGVSAHPSLSHWTSCSGSGIFGYCFLPQNLLCLSPSYSVWQRSLVKKKASNWMLYWCY